MHSAPQAFFESRKKESNNMSKYDALKQEHDQVRHELPEDVNAELDGMRKNGRQWDKLTYVGLACLLGVIGLAAIFA